jgi:hypothetical protein
MTHDSSIAEPRCEVQVALGARSYDILIGDGLIEDAGRIISARFSRARAAIVTDANGRGSSPATPFFPRARRPSASASSPPWPNACSNKASSAAISWSRSAAA